MRETHQFLSLQAIYGVSVALLTLTLIFDGTRSIIFSHTLSLVNNCPWSTHHQHTLQELAGFPTGQDEECCLTLRFITVHWVQYISCRNGNVCIYNSSVLNWRWNHEFSIVHMHLSWAEYRNLIQLMCMSWAKYRNFHQIYCQTRTSHHCPWSQSGWICCKLRVSSFMLHLYFWLDAHVF